VINHRALVSTALVLALLGGVARAQATQETTSQPNRATAPTRPSQATAPTAPAAPAQPKATTVPPPPTPPAAAAPAVPFGTPTTKPGPLTPLSVEIVISRYQGDKKVSSLPYSLAVNANDGTLDQLGQYMPFGGPARLRTGARVPVATMAIPKESPVQGPAGPVSYQSIGTNIDCSARSADDGRFRLSISIDDTSVYGEGQTAQGTQKLNDIPSFRTFQSSNTVILKDGQSTQFTAAADKVTGDVTKVDVTLHVQK